MDYFKGSVDVSAIRLIDRWYEIAGGPQKGNALWTQSHFFDSVDDSRYVCLELSRFKNLVSDHAKYRIWKKRRDCNKKMRGFGVDLSDAAEAAGMKGDGTLGCWSLGYDSRSLSNDPSKRLAGYHATPICWTWDNDIGNFFPYIVEPPTKWDSGNTKEAIWRIPKDEIIFWVSIGGI